MPTTQPLKMNAVLLLVVLIFIATCLLCPTLPLWLVGVSENVFGRTGSVLVSIIPLLFYFVVGILTRGYLSGIPPDAQQIEVDKQQAASLTLAGFCFTSLSLLLSFFKESIKDGDKAPERIVLFFSVALACFIASYLTLKYRTKNLFGFLSDGFIDNGFWCIMIGLLAFFSGTAHMTRPATTVAVLLLFYLGYLALNFYYYVGYARRQQA